MADKNIKFNNLLNKFELLKGKTTLKSVPTTIGVGAHFFCNAKCVFCLGGNYPNFTFDRYKSFFETKLSDILTKTLNVDFHGYGEFLLMPGINKFLKYIDTKIPNQTKTFFTNGVALKNINFPKNGVYNIVVSLHASNKDLHKKIVGIDKFDEIISNIKKVKKQKNVRITLCSILTNLNIDDMENFILLADKLNIKNVIFKYMTIFEYKHFDLSVFFNKKLVNKNFAKALKLSKQLGINISLPYSFKRYKNSICSCPSPWDYFYVENQGNVNKCILADSHIGNLNQNSFNEIWNSSKYQKLRKHLFSRKPDNVCKKCINYDKNNVNKLSSHITFRPDTHKKMLNYIIKNRPRYGLKMEDII
ncbi:MAG: SPASM domain-containing protein [Elusimicrobia bacterium]|nr:SPASM domain-containing protein [Elusimicrobiota bacterium]